MSELNKIIEALASIAWPIIVIVLLIKFRSAISAVLESAKSRKFTIKVGDNELTMEEANEQQRNLIVDLQNQVSDLQKKIRPIDSIDSKALPEIKSRVSVSIQPSPTETSETTKSKELNSILWVDDRPKNNSYETARLQDMGIRVDIALSTADGISKFKSKKYDRIISDMGREEHGGFKSKAGIELIKEIRKLDSKIPIVIYCGKNSAVKLRNEALEAGATEITSSPIVLFEALDIPNQLR